MSDRRPAGLTSQRFRRSAFAASTTALNGDSSLFAPPNIHQPIMRRYLSRSTSSRHSENQNRCTCCQPVVYGKIAVVLIARNRSSKKFCKHPWSSASLCERDRLPPTLPAVRCQAAARVLRTYDIHERTRYECNVQLGA